MPSKSHGPYVDKDWSQKVNSKEKRIARDAAIAATADAELVQARGHRFNDGVKMPIVLGDLTESVDGEESKGDVEKMSLQQGTRKFIAMMECLGLGGDLVRAREGCNIRAGKGKMRGRARRTPKSLLLVVAEKADLARAARNVPGIDVVAAKDLCAEDLAPGGDVGRLTVWTKSAIASLE